jgi:sugar phosphate isomerase/epimerase
MHVQRFLASPWASIHGPSDPRRLLVWLLDAGFTGLAAAPGPRPIRWQELVAAGDDLPVRFPVVRVGSSLAETSATAGLASAKEGERGAALQAVRQAVATAHVLGSRIVVLEPGVVPVFGEVEAEDLGDPGVRWTPERAQALLARRKVGRNGALDRACRELFGICRAFPDFHFCLTTGRSLRAVADLAGLQDIFEDLGSRVRLGYWHDAAVCARRQQVLGEAQGEWLETFGNRCAGFSLGDASSDGIYLPPGSGGVDYGLLASYVRRSGAPTPVVLDLDPAVPPSELSGIRSCLAKYGL